LNSSVIIAALIHGLLSAKRLSAVNVLSAARHGLQKRTSHGDIDWHLWRSALCSDRRLFVESKGSFLWQPNLAIFRPDHEKGKAPWGELDICCLVDGKFVVGEVKYIDNFVTDDFANIRKICEATCPDVALLVFMEGEFKAAPSFGDRLQELQSQLASLTTVEWRKVPSRW
jgi:hypothetical protein